MSYIQRDPDSPHVGYVRISQAVFHANLSRDVLGVLCHLLSLPNDWRIRTIQLARRFRCGKDTILKIFKTLIGAGFMRFQPKRLINGRWTSPVYYVRDMPLELG